MTGSWSVRLQAVLLIALFLGSSIPLVLSARAVLDLPQQELHARSQLLEASGRMAEAGAAWSQFQPQRAGDSLEDLNRQLHAISQRVLAEFPGVEGGFYLGAGRDRFGGYAFPTASPDRDAPLLRSDPPPLEAASIRRQAQDSLAGGETLVQMRDVGPSRVLVATAPVGSKPEAPLAAWTMFRLTGPEDLRREVDRFRVAVGLALAGVALCLALTVSLGRTLKRQSREQDRLREQLRRSEHLAALGKLLAGVAHEVRNPLAGIRSTVQLWQRLPDTARSPQSLEAVIRAVDQLNDIVTRLLYFARVDNAERQPVSVCQLLGETLDLLEAQAGAQAVTIERDLEPNGPQVSGSARALQQVFLNLATNALQAMPNGGRLRCGCRWRPGAVEVRFADTGLGVSPEDRRHLFEPFFTTRPEGTGLGLALCREIAAQHGGRIELEEGEASGATFLVTLPILEGGQS